MTLLVAGPHLSWMNLPTMVVSLSLVKGSSKRENPGWGSGPGEQFLEGEGWALYHAR